MRILLAIDGSEYSTAAVEEIMNRHFATASEVCILAAIEPHYAFPVMSNWEAMDMGNYKELQDMAQSEAQLAVDKAEERLRAHTDRLHLKVTTIVVSGPPKQVILDQADEFKTDLIIMGTHGKGVIEGFLLGSVSHAVAMHAKCSVELVRFSTVVQEEAKTEYVCSMHPEIRSSEPDKCLKCGMLMVAI